MISSIEDNHEMHVTVSVLANNKKKKKKLLVRLFCYSYLCHCHA
jgi:hypothetical protein